MNIREPRLRKQQGSAFILALIVIMLLTILGLSVAVVTETEMQLGATEKALDRQHFAAETGLWAGIAGVVITNQWCFTQLGLIDEPDLDFGLADQTLGYAVATTDAKLIVNGCPAWTDCNEDQGDQGFISTYSLAGATAQRVGYPSTWDSPFEGVGPGRLELATGATVLGETSVALGFFGSPLRSPTGSDADCALHGDTGIVIERE